MLKRKPGSDLPHFKNFLLFVVKIDVTINDLLHNLFFVLSLKVQIGQTRFNVLLEAIDKVLSIKTTLQQLKLI